MNDCDHLRLSLGAHALGSLDAAEDEQIEQHLASCPTCRRELDELNGVLPILATITPADLDPPPLPEDLFSRVVAQIDVTAGATRPAPEHGRSTPTRPRWTRVRTSRGRLLAVAATAVILAAGGTAIGLSQSSPPPASRTASATAAGVHLRVTATSAKTATLLDVRVDGLPRNERCHLVATATDGSRHDAGSWSATYDGHAQLSESTNVPTAQLRRLTLYGSTGQTLAQLHF